MSERIMTLFGEEIVPEQLKAVGKSRAKKKSEEQKEEEQNPVAEKTEEQEPVAQKIEEPKPEQKAEAKPKPEQKTEQEPVPVPENITPAAPITEHKVIAEAITEDVAAIKPVAKPARKKVEVKVNEDNIILPEDWQGEKQYYTIGEVAELFKVKTSNIRFWTNEFKLKVRTTRKGDRLFTPEQIRELRAIHHLVKERGFTLAGAKGKLKTQNNRDVETVDLKQSLLLLRNKLVIIKNQLA